MSPAQIPDPENTSASLNPAPAAEQVATLQADNARLEQQVCQLQQALAASEARCHASETKLNGILNSAIACIASFRAYPDREWEYSYRSAGCEVVFGYTAQEFLSDPNLWVSRVLPEDFTNIVAPAIARIFAEETFQVEYRFQHKDGSLRWLCETTTSRRDEATNSWHVTTVAVDISDRKRIEDQRQQAEVELQRSRDFIQCITDNSPQLLYIFDLVQQRNAYINRQITKILGYTPEEIEQWGSQFFPDCLHPDDAPAIQQALQGWDAISDGEYIEIEYRMRHKNGSWRWLRSRDVVFERDETGHPTKVLGTATDITDQHAVMEEREQFAVALRESERRLRSILDSSPYSIFLKDLQGRYTYVNPTYEQMTQLSHAQLLGISDYDFLPNDFARLCQVSDEAALMSEQPIVFEEQVPFHEGTRTLLITKFALRNAAGQSYSVAGIAIDISDRKALELALRASEAQLKDILDNATAVVSSLRVYDDGSYDYEYMSSGCESVFSYTREELLSDKNLWRSRVFSEDLAQVLLVEQINQEITDIVPYRFRRKDGSLRWLSNHVKVRRDEATHSWLVTIIDIDIHDRKTAEIALEQSEAQYRLLFENNPNPLWIFDHTTLAFLAVNNAAVNHYGYSRAEFLAMTIADIRPVEEVSLLREEILGFSTISPEQRPPSYRGEWQHRKRDGTCIDVEINTHEISWRGQSACFVFAKDITERKQLERALKASEAKLSDILNNAGAAITQFRLFANLQLQYEFYSQGSEAIFGYSVDELMQGEELWISCIHPHDAEHIHLPAFQHLYAERSVTIEFRFRQKDGSWRWISETATSKRDEAADCWIVTCVATDISDRKRVEEALRQSEQIFRQAFETSAFGISIRSPEGRYLRVNQTLCQILGYTEAELLQLTYRDVTHPDDLAIAPNETINKLIAGEIPYYRLEKRFLHKQGHIVWGLISMSLVRDLQQQPLYFVTQVQDITTRKMAELENLRLRERLQFLLSTTPAAIFTCEVEGDYGATFISDNVQTILGYEPQEFVQDSEFWINHIHPDDAPEIFAGLSPLFKDGSHVHEYRFLHQNGTYRWMRNGLNLVRDAAGDPIEIVGYLIDITDRKQLELTLQTSEAKLNDILNNAGAVISRLRVFANREWEYEFLSSTSEMILGYSREELMVDQPLWMRRIPPEDVEQIIIPVFDDIFAERATTIEFRFRRKDNSLRWISSTMLSKRDDAANCWITTCVETDITARKQAEEALRSSEEQLRQIVENIPDVFFLKDSQTKELIYLNSAYETLYGRSCQSLYDDPDSWTASIHPDDCVRIQMKYQQELEGQAFFDDEYRLVRSDGLVRWVWDRTFPIYNEEGNVYRYAGVNRDITNRKQLELALQASEAKLNDILNSAIAAISSFRVYANQDWEYEYWSDGCEAIYGYTPHELMSNKHLWMSRIHPEDLDALVFSKYQNIFTESAFSIEYRFYRKDGSLRWIAGSLTSRRDNDKNCWIATVVSIDITDRKQAEAELQVSEARFQTLVTNMPGMIYRYHPGENGVGAFTYVSSGSYELLELEPNQILQDANSLWKLIHPDDFPSLLTSVAIAVQNCASWHWEGRLTTPSGQLKWIQGNSRPQHTAEGLVWDGLLIDVTDRKQAEIALRQSREELRLITNSLPACIAYLDVERRYRFVNQTYGEWFGYNPEEILGKPIQEVIGEAAYTLSQPYIEQVFAGQTVEYEIELPYPSGNRYINAMLVPQHDQVTRQVQGYYALVTDTSDRKQFEQQLQRSLREKEILLTEIHHRVKNNLQVISSLLDLQANRSQNPHIRTALKISQDRILSMALVHEALYRFEQFAEMNFANYAQGLVNHLLKTYGSSERTVLVHLDIDSSINITLDQAVPCGLILNELVTNVMKYGCRDVEPGHLYVSLERVTDAEIRLTVGNEGDTLPKDFSITRDVSIGFTLVQVLTDQLNGWFEIDKGDRTLFKVTFPLDAT